MWDHSLAALSFLYFFLAMAILQLAISSVTGKGGGRGGGGGGGGGGKGVISKDRGILVAFAHPAHGAVSEDDLQSQTVSWEDE